MKPVFPFAAKDLIVCGLELFFHFYVHVLLQLSFTMGNSVLDLAFYVVTEVFTSAIDSAVGMQD